MSLFDSASLVVTPNGYKEDKLYSIKPTDGSGDLVVTRATTATRVNSAGLVELVTYNLITYSQDFSNAAWTKQNLTLTSGQTSPIGDTTAFRAQFSGVAYLLQSAPTTAATASVYARATSGTAKIRIGDTNGNFTTQYTLTTEWQRITTSGSANVGMSIDSFVDGGWTSQDVQLWGAQLVTGSSAKEYFPTTDRLNVPRLDYTNSSCPSILVEPQRTNITLQSENLATTWYTANGLLTSNATTAPDGTTTADKIKADTTNGIHVYQQTLIVSNATSYTMSVFVKAGEYTFFELADASSLKGQTFNLTAKTISAPQTGGFSAATSSKIEDYGNGWLRCSITYTTVGVTAFFRMSLSNGTTTSFAGNNTNGLFVWGAQLEAGSYVTSYVPTVASSITRNADVISKTGISSLIGQTEGTIFIDFIINAKSGNTNILNSERNTTASFSVGVLNDGRVDADLFSSGSPVARITQGSLVVGQRYKVAYSYKSGGTYLYINGALAGTSTDSFTLPSTIDDIFLNDVNSYFNDMQNVSFKTAALWKTRLTTTELSQLTTI